MFPATIMQIMSKTNVIKELAKNGRGRHALELCVNR
jgi:hypothetical protein